MAKRGTRARQRRRERRAAHNHTDVVVAAAEAPQPVDLLNDPLVAVERGPDPADDDAPAILVVAAEAQTEALAAIAQMAASGGSFDLGARDEKWDAAAAQSSYDLPADGNCYMWKDPEGDPATKAAYKLPFVSKDGGKHAVWGAITAIAAAIQGGRGGVDIPDADKDAIRSKLSGYYTKAAKKYDDDTIKVPWALEAAEEDVETATVPVTALDAEAIRLLALRAFQHTTGCECGHALSEHIGGDGPCKHEDGRGTCSCGSFTEMAVDESAQTVRAALISAFANVMRDAGVEFTEEQAVEWLTNADPADGGLTLAELAEKVKPAVVAAGQLVWGPEDGVMDLLCDLSDALQPDMDDDSPLVDASASYWYIVDIAVSMDKALVGKYGSDECYVAPFTIGADQEPTFAPFDQWVEAEPAWVASTEEARAKYLGQTFQKILAQFSVAAAPTTSSSTRLSADITFAAAAPVAESTGEAEPQTVDVTPPEDGPSDGLRHWEGTIAPEGVLTSDGRMFAEGALTWRDLPLTLMAQLETQDGHDGAQVAGRIDRIWREGNLVRAEGVFDAGEFGTEIARMVDERVLRGVSVDVAVQSAEIVSRMEVTGQPVPDGAHPDIVVITSGEIGAVTVCSFPAFAEASITLTAAAGEAWTSTVVSPLDWVQTECGCEALTASVAAPEAPAEVEPRERVDTVTAAAAGLAPLRPPSAWFDAPELNELTPLVVTPEGRVYGHAAAWDTCHIGIPGTCTVAPRTQAEYRYFMLGTVECEDGESRDVGTITLDTGHAAVKLGADAAAKHYDHTGVAVAHVAVGEDEHGIWVAGALHPDADEVRVRELRGAKLSGDWRGIDGNLELVALLAVNVPGFPVPRPHAAVTAAASGVEPHALTAAGIVEAAETPPDASPDDGEDALQRVIEMARAPLTDDEGE